MISQTHDIVVIADASCLIALTNIEALNLLKELYSEIYITSEIAIEFGENLPQWIKIVAVKNTKYQQILDLLLDKGEASAIAMAMEYSNVLLILDDLKGRKEAQRLGFRITGTLGLLFKAKTLGLIEKITPYIKKLKEKGFRISPKIEEDILRQSGEL